MKLRQLDGIEALDEAWDGQSESLNDTGEIGAEGKTYLISPVMAGLMELPVESQNGFELGQHVVIDAGSSEEEFNEITGFGSLLLKYALRFDHSPGTTVDAIPKPVLAKTCLSCKNAFASDDIKFCSNCGVKRELAVTNISFNSSGSLFGEDTDIFRWTAQGATWAGPWQEKFFDQPETDSVVTQEQLSRIQERRGWVSPEFEITVGHFKRDVPESPDQMSKLSPASDQTLLLTPVSAFESGRQPSERVVVPCNWRRLHKMWPLGRDMDSRNVRWRLFRAFDINGNGLLGVLEVSTVAVSHVNVAGIKDYSPAVTLAFQSMRGVMPLDNTINHECLGLRSFRIFLMFLCRYTELWVHWCAMNVSGGKTVTRAEFAAHVPQLKGFELEDHKEMLQNPERSYDEHMGTIRCFSTLFTYSWVQHQNSPLEDELEDLRESRGISKAEWVRRLVLHDASNREVGTLTPEKFPIAVRLRINQMRFVDFCLFVSKKLSRKDKWDQSIEPEDLIQEACDCSYSGVARYRGEPTRFQDIRDKFPLGRDEESAAFRAKQFINIDFSNRAGRIAPFECHTVISNDIFIPGVMTFMPPVRLAFEQTKQIMKLKYDPANIGADWESFYCLFYELQRHVELWVRFVSFDSSGDHRLDKDEFASVVMQLQLCGIVSANIVEKMQHDPNSVFTEIDLDHNGCVRFREFVGFCIDHGPPLPDLSPDPRPPEIVKHYASGEKNKTQRGKSPRPVEAEGAKKPKNMDKKKGATPRFKHPTEEEVAKKKSRTRSCRQRSKKAQEG